MTNSDGERRFDLEERTAQFGERVIQFCRALPTDAVNDPLISQLVRSATSVGANYCEANDAVSRKDFRHRIGICRKESKEAKHWLRMIGSSQHNVKPEARRLWQEASELNLIFSTILRKLDANDSQK